MRRRTGIQLLTVFLLFASGCDRGTKLDHAPRASFAGSPRKGGVEVTLGKDFKPIAGQTIYVPAYSAVATSNDARPFNLAITLSIRNTDRVGAIVVTRLRYQGHDGALVRDYAKSPLRLGPLASMDLFIAESDTSGGASTSFLVDWLADREVSAPVVEAVMIGTASTQGISFVCPGRVLAHWPP